MIKGKITNWKMNLQDKEGVEYDDNDMIGRDVYIYDDKTYFGIIVLDVEEEKEKIFRKLIDIFHERQKRSFIFDYEEHFVDMYYRESITVEIETEEGKKIRTRTVPREIFDNNCIVLISFQMCKEFID